MEDPRVFPIPARLNLIISAAQTTALLCLLRLSADASGWWLAAVAIGYGLVMNSAYAMLHEAQHGILHPDRRINESVGAVLTLFFPAPFHLARQGHLGHHLRNRSDDEAFDFYFEGESRVWRFLQLYGILTGLFWFVILLGTVAAVFCPSLLRPKPYAFDRRTTAMLGSMNPSHMWLVRLEGLAALVLHGGLIWWWRIPFWHWFATMVGFGVMWSAMQYVHHFGTERDVAKGAVNLRIFPLLDWLWLNHHWHLRHHQHPTVSWLYLPRLKSPEDAPRRHMLSAYLHMWRGPRLTHDHVENRYAGKIIR
jgi:fatty acid desaturase